MAQLRHKCPHVLIRACYDWWSSPNCQLVCRRCPAFTVSRCCGQHSSHGKDLLFGTCFCNVEISHSASWRCFGQARSLQALHAHRNLYAHRRRCQRLLNKHGWLCAAVPSHLCPVRYFLRIVPPRRRLGIPALLWPCVKFASPQNVRAFSISLQGILTFVFLPHPFILL